MNGEPEEFTFKYCKSLGFKTWQCPPFLFSISALVLLGIAGLIATKYVLTTTFILLILGVFSLLLILSAYVIVKIFNKAVEKKHYF